MNRGFIVDIRFITAKRNTNFVHAPWFLSTAAVLANSIDAGATSVEINVDLPSHRLSVTDDGRGIPSQQLESYVATARGEFYDVSKYLCFLLLNVYEEIIFDASSSPALGSRTVSLVW